MKLTMYPNLPFEIDAGTPTIICTNNQKFYGDLVMGCQWKQNLVLSDNDETLELDESLAFLGNLATNSDVFQPFKAKIEKEVLNNLNEKDRQQLYRLDQEIKGIFLNAVYLEDFPLAVNDDWDIKKQYKYCEISFLREQLTSFYDIIKAVLNLYHKFNSQELIILNDFFNYLDDQEQAQIFKLVKSLELSVLLLDFSWQPYSQLLEECRYYSVDKDFVVFER